MKSIVLKLASVLLGLALFTGCQSADSHKTGRLNPDKIVILFGNPPKNYVEVGTVATPKTQPNPGDTWQASLQQQAAKLDADAILVDTSTLDTAATSIVTGKAIRYQ